MEPAKAFDPYYKWLGIPPKDQPPTLYRLLGLEQFETDSDVIESAADRQMAHLRQLQIGPHSALSQRLLNEVAAARRCLLDAEQKAAYDESLRAAQQSAALSADGFDVAAEAGSAFEAAAPETFDELAASLPREWAAPMIDATAEESPAVRPWWREPIVIGAAAGGLAIGAAVVAVVLFSSAPQDVEEGRSIASAAGANVREPRAQPLERARPETPVVRNSNAEPRANSQDGKPVVPGSFDAAARKLPLERESAPSRPRVDVAAPTAPHAAMPPATAPASPGGKPPALLPGSPASSRGGGAAGAPAVPAPMPPEKTPPANMPPAETPSASLPRIEYTTIGEPIDLLKRVVPSRDAVNGDWHFEGEALVSPVELHWARLQLRVDVPAEYIFTVEIARPSQHDNLSLGLVAGGSQFMYCATAFRRGGLFLLDGKEWHVNETSYPAGDIFHPGPNTIACMVHRKGIIARVNHRTLIDWEGDFSRLTLQSLWQIPSKKTLFLGTDPRYEFTKVELQAIRTQAGGRRR